jgi:hypothetical protein
MYVEFITDADEMYKRTNKLVNMYKTGSDAQTAICLAYKYLNENNISAENITFNEFKVLEDASHGPLVFADNKREGKFWLYDINSSYPSIYSSPYFMIPIREGEFKTLSKSEFENIKHYSYGIFNVKITYPDDSSKWRKLFRLNYSNKYTHYELTYARELNLNMELIENGESNYLYYARESLLTGSECFKEYVQLLYPLRQNNIIANRAKSLLRALWGALCQKNEYKMIVDFETEFEPREDKEVTTMNIIPDQDKYEVYTVTKDKPYETNYARMKPFLLSKARIKISKLIEPYHEHIHKCHTDSMLSDIELPIKTSLKLGDIKLEDVFNGTIVNSNTVIKTSSHTT